MMNENRLQAPMLLIALLLALCMLFAGAPRQTRGQEADRRTDRLRRELLDRLASGDEEQRIDSLVRICALLRDEPDAIETRVITSIGVALQRDSSAVVRALAARAPEICAAARAMRRARRCSPRSEKSGSWLCLRRSSMRWRVILNRKSHRRWSHFSKISGL